MPKIVDHDGRREELVRATWRIIAAGGFEAATLHSIEAEAGYSHGVVRHYFASKDQLLARAFETAYEHTLQRAVRSIGADQGLSALRKLCLELLPLDAERYTEAQVVVAFWDRAANDPELAATHLASVETWNRHFLRHLASAAERGEIAEGVDRGLVADHLLLIVNGAQVSALLTPGHAGPERQVTVLDGLLDTLRPQKY